MKKLQIATVTIFALLIILLFALRALYVGNNEITSEELYLFGIENGIGIPCGDTVGGVYISVPNEMNIKDIVSVSSDTDVAYLKLYKDQPYNERVIKAEIIGVSEGIAELYVRSPDGKFTSEKFTVNCFLSEEKETVITTETVTEAVTTDDIHNPVYVTPHGSKYHLNKSCAGDTASTISLEDAVAEGYQPCKKCAIK